MAVAADDEHIGLRGDELANLIAFVGEAFVGMVIVLFTAIGADDRRRANEDTERGVRLFHGLEEPSFLFLSPNRFLWPVFHGVGGAEIASFDHPHLQVFAPADRAVGRLADGKLLFENAQSLFPSEVAVVHPGPSIVHQGIMIILHEIAAHLAVEIAPIGHGHQSIPFESGERLGNAIGLGFVVIFDVSGVHIEVGLYLLSDRFIYNMSVLRIISPRVVAAGDDCESDSLRLFGGGSGAEASFEFNGGSLCSRFAAFHQEFVSGIGL